MAKVEETISVKNSPYYRMPDSEINKRAKKYKIKQETFLDNFEPKSANGLKNRHHTELAKAIRKMMTRISKLEHQVEMIVYLLKNELKESLLKTSIKFAKKTNEEMFHEFFPDLT